VHGLQLKIGNLYFVSLLKQRFGRDLTLIFDVFALKTFINVR